MQEQNSVSKCRFCNSNLHFVFSDLGMSPLCESFVTREKYNSMEPFYPLRTYVCEKCFLVQLDEYVSPAEIFSEYGYFSSFSNSWLEHARKYVEKITDRFSLGNDNLVIEVASNDGYLLQYFVEKNIPVLGIEPAANIAKYANDKDIRTENVFLGKNTATELVKKYRKADLLLGNNVLAHVPDINDFTGGLKILLEEGGVLTMEFPHLVRLMEENQFDTIYHEHFSYLSLFAVSQVFAIQGLEIFDAEELTTHGGSLRIYAKHAGDPTNPVSRSVRFILDSEMEYGINNLTTYTAFNENVKETKRKILEFLIQAKREGKSIAGYGAPGKGNTLLNYCGIRTDFIDYTVDRNPYKHNQYLPGTHIPVFATEKILDTKPDYIFILPWNLKNEIMGQLKYVREWGAKFVIPIPELKVY